MAYSIVSAAPVVLGVVVVFLSYLLTAVGFLRERTAGPSNAWSSPARWSGEPSDGPECVIRTGR